MEHGFSQWRKSSQTAYNLINNGTKLWTKNDLCDIEEQLAQSIGHESFTVRSIQGTFLSIKNPMFHEQSPIW